MFLRCFILLSSVFGVLSVSAQALIDFDSDIRIIDSTLNQSMYFKAQRLIDSLNTFALAEGQKAVLHIRRGHVFKGLGRADGQLEEYLAALEIWRQLGNEKECGDAYLSIGNTYWQMGRNDEALECYNITLESALKFDDAEQYAGALENISVVYSTLDSSALALEYLDQSISYFLRTSDYLSCERCYNSVGYTYYSMSELDSAVANYQRALALPIEPGTTTGLVLNNLGLAYEGLNELDSARHYYLRSLELCESIDVPRTKEYVLRNLGELYALEGDYKTGYEYLQELRKHLRAQSRKDKAAKVLELQESFQAAERELEIEKRTAQRNALIGIVVALVVISGLIFFFVRRNQRVKLQLANKTIALKDAEISSMFSELTLERTAAQAEGELSERRRFGRELHDRIGPMLSSIKLKFSAIGETMDAKDVEELEHGLSLLDSSVEEIRRISHNLSSGVLAKVGFLSMIEQLVERINKNGEIDVRFTHHGLSEGLSPAIENELIAIIQEVIHNTLKHSNANTLSIDISKDDDEVSVVIEDNGRGFDPRTVSTGIGLKNLRYRFDQLSGHMTIDSQVGRGTVVLIDVPLSQSQVA